ncbi:MAG: alpha-ribazole phosphatase [Thermoproteota archaeon]|nr:alpha-ribazole phosphatase [Thermoproteota archaeon]
MKELLLMRHGLTRENELQVIIGITDPSLSDNGKEKLYSIRECVVKPDIVLCSELKRVRETAEILFPNSDIQAIPQLRERDFGVLEGKTLVYARETGLLQTQDETILRKNGIETPTALLSRASQVVNYLSQLHAKKIVVISHRTFINYILRVMLPENKIGVIPHTHYHQIVFDLNEKIIYMKINQSWCVG